MTKPLLVAVSHAIERFALASDRDTPLAVIAMFQRLSYFGREAHVYRDIATRAALTVVGVVHDTPPTFPSAVSPVLLDEHEPLAREWSITVLSPRSGATLVAQDLESIDGSARSLEQGRLFSGWWSFRRSDAYDELVRLRTAMGPRLSTAQIRRIDEVLTQVVAVRGSDTDDRMDAAMGLLVDQLSRARRNSDHAHQRLDEMDPGRERDPRTGLQTSAFLDRWTARSATGTLPVGLILLRVHDLAQARERYGFRAELAVLQAVARTLRTHLTTVDRVVRVGPEEFLLVLPSRDRASLAGTADQVRAAIARLDQAFPFVPTPTTATMTCTRQRPLPIAELRAALEEATQAGIPVSMLAA